MKRWICAALITGITGCHSTPGFRIGAEFTIPPTIANSAPLTPVPSLPTTAYMVEAPTAPPTFQRQYSIAPAQQMPYAPPPPPSAAFRAEQLPMPKQSGCANPCQ